MTLFHKGGHVKAPPKGDVLTRLSPCGYFLPRSHFDENGDWIVPAYPKNARVLADFTGIAATMETNSITEAERMRVEAEEESWEQPAFQDTVDVGADRQTLAPANDGPTISITISDYSERHLRQALGLPEAANDDLPPAIGLSGFAQSGKTTVANYIELKYGYRRQHIAEPLRAMLRTLLSRFGMPDELITEYLTGSLKEELIPELGITSRQAQIRLGTEWGRQLVHPDLWANLWAVEAERDGGRAMNDSVRFKNEEEAIRQNLGGFTILVTRPGTSPVAYKWGGLGRFLYTKFGLMWGVHPSERVDQLTPDYIILNEGSFEALYDQVDEIFKLEAAYQRVSRPTQ